jgi:hypothetical protein
MRDPVALVSKALGTEIGQDADEDQRDDPDEKAGVDRGAASDELVENRSDHATSRLRLRGAHGRGTSTNVNFMLLGYSSRLGTLLASEQHD